MPSTKEIKLKARVDDFAPFRERLKPIAKLVKKASYADYFFKSDSSGPVSELRIRNSTDKKVITVKLLVRRNSVQVNTEYSFAVDRPEDFVGFLETLGFSPSAELKKSSEVFNCGDIRVELSKIESLGNYIELTIHTSEDSIGSDIEKIEAFAARLGITTDDIDSRYYSQLSDL